jgi:hypothetical protein
MLRRPRWDLAVPDDRCGHVFSQPAGELIVTDGARGGRHPDLSQVGCVGVAREQMHEAELE